MSEVSNPQAEQVAQHPLEAVLEKLEYLVRSLRMELEVAPTDRKAHQDLLRRLIQASEGGLQIPDRAWPVTVYPDAPAEAITIVDDEEEFNPEIQALRQQGWKIMTVTQFSQHVEELAGQKSGEACSVVSSSQGNSPCALPYLGYSHQLVGCVVQQPARRLEIR